MTSKSPTIAGALNGCMYSVVWRRARDFVIWYSPETKTVDNTGWRGFSRVGRHLRLHTKEPVARVMLTIDIIPGVERDGRHVGQKRPDKLFRISLKQA
jgi:hypothetical protein